MFWLNWKHLKQQQAWKYMSKQTRTYHVRTKQLGHCTQTYHGCHCCIKKITSNIPFIRGSHVLGNEKLQFYLQRVFCLGQIVLRYFCRQNVWWDFNNERSCHDGYQGTSRVQSIGYEFQPGYWLGTNSYLLHWRNHLQKYLCFLLSIHPFFTNPVSRRDITDTSFVIRTISWISRIQNTYWQSILSKKVNLILQISNLSREVNLIFVNIYF